MNYEHQRVVLLHLHLAQEGVEPSAAEYVAFGLMGEPRLGEGLRGPATVAGEPALSGA